MLKFVKSVFFVGFFVLSVVMSGGCGSGGSSCGFDDPTTPTFDLDGTWTFTVTSTSSSDPDCDGFSFGPFTITIEVSGNTVNITVADDPDLDITGEVSGSQVKLGGSFSEDGASITIDCTTMTVVGGTSFSFTGTGFNASADGESCSGTASGTFTKI